MRYPADFSCNPDFNVGMVGVATRWTPVKNLTFSAEALWIPSGPEVHGYRSVDAGGSKPTAVYEYKDQDTVSFNVRAQRNF